MRLLSAAPLLAILSASCGSPALLAQDKEIKTLASTLSGTLSILPKKTVAVVDFTDLQGNVTELGRFLAEELSVALTSTDRGIEVIDRTHLKTLLQENKLAATGIIDSATARKLGEIAGVQILITGTITPFGDSVRSSVKALDAATARIMGASIIEIPRTKAIEELLARGISPTTAQTVSSGELSGTRQRIGEAYAGETKRVRQLEVGFKGCRTRPEGILCEVLIWNLVEDREYCLFSGNRSRIVDDLGNVYTSQQVRLAEASQTGVACARLTSGVPTIGRLLFVAQNGLRQLPNEGTHLELVQFYFDLANYGDRSPTTIDVQFRGVIVTR